MQNTKVCTPVCLINFFGFYFKLDFLFQVFYISFNCPIGTCVNVVLDFKLLQTAI